VSRRFLLGEFLDYLTGLSKGSASGAALKRLYAAELLPPSV